jgi:tetratricopeptide (TPR) repeat protein
VWVGILVFGAAAGLWFARGSRAPAPADPAAGLDPVRAYEIGLRLGQAKRFMESVPYFRRAAEAPGGSTWQVRHDYSSSLHNATLESRMVGRYGHRLARSSVERIAMMRESLRQLDLAAADAGAARDRAFLEAIRGNTLATWGFPLDALACYQRALALDPTMRAVPTDGK